MLLRWVVIRREGQTDGPSYMLRLREIMVLGHRSMSGGEVRGGGGAAGGMQLRL